MCGFSGLLTANRSHPQAAEWKSRFADAAQRIAHRGNDDSRFLNFQSVSLHHFRLAFQDLESGRQPMLSKDGATAITFNGEIYNHLELRKELEKKYGNLSWRTYSDTETILEGWLLDGTSFIDRLEGEFAFVISRTDGSEWMAARDYFGVKPLFLALADINTRIFSDARPSYTLHSSLVSFASEMKALPNKKAGIAMAHCDNLSVCSNRFVHRLKTLSSVLRVVEFLQQSNPTAMNRLLIELT